MSPYVEEEEFPDEFTPEPEITFKIKEENFDLSRTILKEKNIFEVKINELEDDDAQGWDFEPLPL